MTSSDRDDAAQGRPSLFAAQDSRTNALADPAGVRILSTLESQQRPPPRRRVGDASARAQGAPQTSGTPSSHDGRTARWMLWSLVTMGLALAGGGLWLSGEIAEPPSRLVSVPTPVALAKAPVAVPTPSPPVQLAAVIENSPPQAGLVEQLSTTPENAAQGEAADQPAPPPKKRKDDKARAAIHKAKLKGKADDDVALLEAMFTHAGKRQAPSSATQQLAQQCGPLSGTEARACQSRVCQQFPAASVCR